MINKIYIITFTLVTILSFSSYASADFEITPDIDTLIPENALMYFQISNPEEFMINIDSFLENTGINQMLGGMPLLDYISLYLDSEDTDISLDYINWIHPLGFAVLPTSGKYSNSKELGFIFFLPINTGMDILKLLANKPEDDNIWYKIHMNYLVFFSSKNLKDNFLSNKIINLSNMDRYSKDSLSIYFNPTGIKENFGLDIPPPDSIKELEYNNSTESAMASRIIQGYLNLLHLIDSLFSNIKIDRREISIQSDIFFPENVKRILKSFSIKKDIKKWSAYLPENAYFQSIYSIDSKANNLIMEKIMGYLFHEYEEDPIMLELKQSIDIFSKYTGDGGAFSFDFTPSLNRTGKGNESIPLGISLNMVTELSDPILFINEFRKIYSSQSLNSLMNSLYINSGFKVQIKMEEELLNGISPVFKIKYDVKEKKTKSGNNHNEMAPYMSFLNNIEFWYYISDGKIFTYIGSEGIEGITKLLIPDGNDKIWINSAPDNSNIIWNISLTKFLKELDNLPGLQKILPVSNIPINISGFTSIENGTIHSSSNISSEDIGNIFKLITEIDF